MALLTLAAAALAVLAALAVRRRRRAHAYLFEGKHILITGASAGLGQEMALQCARRGARLSLLARREGLLAELAAECEKQGAWRAAAIPCDVTDRKACSGAVERAVSLLGQIDVLVLNAGASQGCFFEDVTSLDDASRLVDLNLMGCVNITHCALPHVAKRSSSRLVYVSSIAGCLGVPYRSLYCATKWAVNGFASSLRVELGDAYGDEAPKVVLTCPPEIRTELNTSRLQFGAGRPAESTPEVQLPVEPSVTRILEGIAEGTPLQHFSAAGNLSRVFWLAPHFFDRLVLKKIKRTTIRNGQGR